MESIIANLNKTKANDDKAIGFRDMPKNEKKKWIAKFKKHQSQNSISVSRNYHDVYGKDSSASGSATEIMHSRKSRRKRVESDSADESEFRLPISTLPHLPLPHFLGDTVCASSNDCLQQHCCC